MSSPADKGPTIIGVTMLFELFAFIALVLRIWSQKIVRRRFLVHDGLALLGFIFATALAICLIISVVDGGLGKHTLALVTEPWRLILFGKLLIVIQVLWALSMTCIRISILCLYIHLLAVHSKTFRYACYAVMVVCVLWIIGDLLVVFLLCQPLSYNWDKTTPGGHCGNITSAYLAAHGSNFGIDSTIALLPIPTLWKLQLPQKKKLAVIAMFSLGALICAISIARIVLYQQALQYDQTDFTYSGTTLYIFTVMEPLVACSIACLPLVRPAAEKVSVASKGSWTRSRGTKQSSSKLTDPQSNLGHNDTEGLYHENGGSNRPWARMSNGSSAMHDHADHDRQSYEMAHHP